jgi:hypothetical protein
MTLLAAMSAAAINRFLPKAKAKAQAPEELLHTA